MKCSLVKCSEGLSNRVSIIIRRYTDHKKFVTYMAVWFTIFFQVFWFCFLSLYIRLYVVRLCLILYTMYYYCYVYVFLLLCLCILIVIFIYSYCYICSVLCILFHCIVLCTVCV